MIDPIAPLVAARKISIVRLFESGQVKGSEWLSPNHYVVSATVDLLEEAQAPYELMRESSKGHAYFGDYLRNVPTLMGDHWCDTKYLIKNTDGVTVAYLGLETGRRVVIDFAHIPLMESGDPRLILLIKQWLHAHPDYDKIYYTMRYGKSKRAPLDAYLGVILLGRVQVQLADEDAHHTYYMRTLAGRGGETK